MYCTELPSNSFSRRGNTRMKAFFKRIDVIQNNGDLGNDLISCEADQNSFKYTLTCHVPGENEIETGTSSLKILLIIAVICCLFLLAAVFHLGNRIRRRDMELEDKVSRQENENQVSVEAPEQQ